jgi:hypothetical protein
MNAAIINKYLQDNPLNDPRRSGTIQQYMKQEDATSSKTQTSINGDQVIVTFQGLPYLNRVASSRTWTRHLVPNWKVVWHTGELAIIAGGGSAYTKGDCY